jgi:hypothetical protein
MFLFLYISIASSSVIVYSPVELREELKSKYNSGSIPASLGNFGNPPYGTSLVGTVFQPESIKELDGCSPLTPIKFNKDDPDHNSSPILLLERGNCAFVIKVRHAEDIGARLVLIVNNKDSDIDSIIMTDNGLGGNLKIPAFLISREDGQTIRDYLEKPEFKYHVNLAVQFDMSKGSGKVKSWIYSSPTNTQARTLIGDLSTYIQKFDTQNLEFAHHFVLWYCPECAEKGYKEDNKDCISGGRYCFLDPDEKNDEINGRQIMLEDLRLMCLFNLTSKKDYSDYFEYHSMYNQKCKDSKFLTESCSKDVIEGLGVKYEKVQDCVKNSFNGNDYAIDDNRAMKVEREHIFENFMPFEPAIVINDQLYRGDLEAEPIFQAICSGYGWGLKPKFCEIEESEESSGKSTETKSKVSKALIIVAIILSILLIIAILVVYRAIVKKDLNRDMKIQVNNAVAQYFQLAENPRT